MKTIAKLLFFFSFISTFTFAQPVTEGLVAYYPFDDQTANDVSGNNSNGVIVGNIISVPDRDGNEDAAFSFSVDDTKILLLGIINNIFISDTTFSISFWYKGSTLDETDYETIFHKTETGIPDSPDSLSLGIFLENKMVFSQSSQLSDTIDTDEWNHVVFTYNHGHRSMFINCVQQGSSSLDFFEDNLGVVTIGEPYSGVLDDMAFYNKVLTHEEIASLHQSPCTVISAVNEEHIIQDLKCFPNPTNGVILIETNRTKGSIELVDQLGKIHYTQKINNSSTLQINMNDFPGDIYYFILKNEIGNVTDTEVILKKE